MRFLSFIFCIGIVFSLNSCSIFSEESIEGTTVVDFTGDDFHIKIPDKWEYSQTTDSLPQPGKGNIVLAAVSPETKYGFANNIVIIKDTLEHIVSSEKYSQANNEYSGKKYREYAPVSHELIIFEDTDSAYAYVFDVRYNADTPRVRSIQTAKVCGTSVYILHFSVEIGRDPKNYIELLKTFQCK